MPFWESSIFWGIAGIVASIMVSLFFFLYGKNKKILKYKIYSIKLISDNLSTKRGLDITFKGQRVRNMISSVIEFSNVGNQVITSDDFAKSAPLKISAENNFFGGLDGCNIMPRESKGVNISEISKKELNIVFEFLQPKQSFSIEVLHDGDISVQGVLKTGKIVNSFSRKSLLMEEDFSVCSIIAFATWFFVAGLQCDISEDPVFSLKSVLVFLLFPTCISAVVAFIYMIIAILWNVCFDLIAKLKSK